MPQINFAKMYDPEAATMPREGYKQKMALANALMGGEAPSAIYSGGAAAAHIASKAMGGLLAGQAEREEREAGEASWAGFANSPLVKGLIEGAATSSGNASPGSPSAGAAPPNTAGGFSTSAHGGDPYTGGGEDAALYRQAIKDIESSGGNYGIVGPTHPKYGRALGAYQVMESNLPEWSQQVLGRVVTPDEFLKDKNIQDRIFDAKFGESVQKYGSPEDAASVWFTGRPRGTKGSDTAKDSLGTSGSDYVGKFASNLSRYRNQKPAPMDDAALVASVNQPAGAPQGGPVKVASADPNFVPQNAAAPSPQPAATPMQVAQAGPSPQALAQGLQGGAPQASTGLPPQLQETARQLLQLGKNPRNRPYVMQQMGVLQQQALELQQQEQQRAYDAQKEQRQRGYQVEDRELAWERERPYKDSASSVAQGNLDVARERLEIDRKPTSVREAEAAMANPDVKATMLELKRSGATSIDMGGGSSKQIFDSMEKGTESARAAASGIASIRQARQALKAGGIFGAGADTRLGLQKLATSFGIGNPEDLQKITNTETFRSAIAPQVASTLRQVVGSTNISNSDREFAAAAAGGSISLEPGSIERLLDIMERSNMDILQAHGKRLDAVYPDGGNFGRERALFGVPIPEAMAQAATGGAQAPAAPAQIKTPEEFQALPSGALFVAPDGTTRRKP